MFVINEGVKLIIEGQAYTTGKPIYIWLADHTQIEDGALIQLIQTSNLPCVFHHVSAMPDVHQGYGLPIGGVMALKDYVSPYSVGSDIGCGMCAVKTSIPLEEVTKDLIIDLRRRIRKRIPMGSAMVNEDAQIWDGFAEGLDTELSFPIDNKKRTWIKKSLKTLGGGNHFIELQSDGKFLHFMLHSGSRNLGSIVCDNHHNIALDLCNKWFTPLPADRLAFLPVNSNEGKNYLHDMNYALSFAKENRRRMMVDVIDAAMELWPDLEVISMDDVHHNYASLENHFGRNVYVHRKGATSARAGEIGIIPGSQGTNSYIVEGLGNMFSFSSCSHGAGRKMGRNDACKKLDLQEEANNMTGIIADSFGTRMLKIDGVETEMPDLGEASGAYKDIKTVMENQAELVTIKTELYPLGCLKGKA